MNNKNFGQSLVDLIFSVAIVVLVLSGVVVLLVSSVSTKTRSFDRKTAGRMAEVVMEKMMKAREADPEGFFESPFVYATTTWQTLTEFPGYTYTIVFNNSDSSIVECPSCVLVTVTVQWTAKEMQILKLNRVFSRI
ncbi:MAG: hypothetical protein WC841_02560 [Candidatus Shapirobacteria bacterium]|jgi:hypothetical protein